MGYGVITVDSVNRYVHRVVYEHHHGVIPDGLLVRHTCDNPICCNPDHLVLGTHKDNSEDAVARGRMPAGERAANAKLTAGQIEEIRRRLETGERHKDIAAAFGVARSSVTRISLGTAWRDT